MKRKRNSDRPLLAGRLKPYRRPPASGAPAAGLRLHSSTPGAGPTIATPPMLAAAIERAEAVVQAMHFALEGFSRILNAVGALETAIKSALDQRDFDGQEFANSIAELLTQIDFLADGVCDAAGRPLLDGNWMAELIDAVGRTTVPVTLPRISTQTLGSDAVGGRLTSLPTMARRSPAVAMAIVRSAVLWLAGERERVFRILADVIEPLVAELETIEANCGAASTAAQAEFAADLAGITKLHALAASQSTTSPKTPPDAQQNGAYLRIRRTDDD